MQLSSRHFNAQFRIQVSGMKNYLSKYHATTNFGEPIQLIYWNRDTWPCPESGFRPEFIPLGEEQAILEYNFDFEYTMIGPQNATTNYLHLKLNATYLEVCNSTSLMLYFQYSGTMDNRILLMRHTP